MYHKFGASLLAINLAVFNSAAVFADQGSTNSDDIDFAAEIEEIKVYGRALEQIGVAKSASQGTVGYNDFKDRPLSRVGELVEVIPGAVATQHSGEGKANQYFLRGFNLDHGTDFSATVDGVPINMRSHGHGQGYLDLNFIIPEIVEKLEYRKGPYYADLGDFSSAGAAGYSLYDTLDQSFVKLTAGRFGFRRAVAAVSAPVADSTTLLVAAEGAQYDGPWELEQDLDKVNVHAKLSHQSGAWKTSVALNGYHTKYTATDQVPERAVSSSSIGRFGFIDGDLGGETDRYSFSIQSQHESDSSTITDISAYIVDYKFSLFSNFTYFLDDPVNGDEFEQLDNRTYFGAAVSQSRSVSDALTLSYGIETRVDDISAVGLFQTQGRLRINTIRQDKLNEYNISGWSSAELDLNDSTRLTLGLRADHFGGEVETLSLPINSGSSSDTLVSPSIGLAWRASDALELYANYGHGFHSNDIRGTTISRDPRSGESIDPVPLLVKSIGGEIGARFEWRGLTATLSAFALSLDSELVFVGDAGSTEANDGSDRYGLEASLFWQPTDWLAIDGSYATTHARFDIAGPEDRIPGAVDDVFAAGFVADLAPITFSARLRHFGSAPLIESGDVVSDATTLVNAAAAYEWSSFVVSVELLNVFNARENDISYFFESQLPGETSPQEDIHFHPVEPRQLRASLTYRF